MTNKKNKERRQYQVRLDDAELKRLDKIIADMSARISNQITNRSQALRQLIHDYRLPETR